MDFFTVITVVNWIVILGLGTLVGLETISPKRGGGDAAGRGLGEAFYWLAVIAFVVLLILNLLPHPLGKKIAFGLIVTPVTWWTVGPPLRKFTRKLVASLTPRKPLFPDRERDQLSHAIEMGNVEQFKKWLAKTTLERLNEGGEILGFAVSEVTRNEYKPKERMECVRLLLAAGTRVDLADTLENPLLIGPASSGCADLMRLLLEHGAKADVSLYYLKHHILFEAADSYREPEAVVRVLLEHGAPPDVTTRYGDESPVTPLFFAAKRGRWGVCLALLEHGANPDFRVGLHQTFRTLFAKAEKGFSPNGYSTVEDFERLQAWVRR